MNRLPFAMKVAAALVFVQLFQMSNVQSLTPSSTAEVYILSPKNGAKVKSPVRVVFGLKNMGVAPAGVNVKNTGHHHLLVDAKSLPDMKLAIPSDKNHIHFGGGQTETSIDLSPGKHTLQLIMGDANHIPHSEPIVSKKITIEVKK